MILYNYKRCLAPLLFTGVFLGLIGFESIAQDGGNNGAKYSNSFLNIGVGARNLGMGGAVIASVADATAGYWNPAGLVEGIQKSELALMHAEYFTSIANYDYGAFGHRLDENNALGFSILRLGIDDIPNTLNLVDPNGNIDYNRIESFSAADYAFLFSYSRKFKDPTFRMGANFKIIRRVVGKFANAWGFGIDLAARKDFGPFTVGVAARDLTNTFNFWTFDTEEFEQAFAETGNVIPVSGLELTRPSLAFGISRDWSLGESLTLLTETDFNMYLDGKRNALISTEAFSGDFNVGLELNYLNKFFFRSGLKDFQRSTSLSGVSESSIQPSLGAGVRIRNVVLDYAITDLGRVESSLYSNVISLLIQFRD